MCTTVVLGCCKVPDSRRFQTHKSESRARIRPADVTPVCASLRQAQNDFRKTLEIWSVYIQTVDARLIFEGVSVDIGLVFSLDSRNACSSKRFRCYASLCKFAPSTEWLSKNPGNLKYIHPNCRCAYVFESFSKTPCPSLVVEIGSCSFGKEHAPTQTIHWFPEFWGLFSGKKHCIGAKSNRFHGYKPIVDTHKAYRTLRVFLNLWPDGFWIKRAKIAFRLFPDLI